MLLSPLARLKVNHPLPDDISEAHENSQILAEKLEEYRKEEKMEAERKLSMSRAEERRRSVSGISGLSDENNSR